MKKYFLYELKKNLPCFFIVTFISLLFYVMPIAIDTYSAYYMVSYIETLMVVIAFAFIVVPAHMFSYRMKRRSTDLYFALPISRTKLLAVKYVVGFISVLAAYTVAYVLGFVIAAVKYAAELQLGYYLALYFASIIPFYIIYSIASFGYTRANSNKDGVMFIIFAMLAVLMITLLLSNFFQGSVVYTYEIEEGVYDSYSIWSSYIVPGYFMPTIALDCTTEFFIEMIAGYSFADSNLFSTLNYETVNRIISLILFTGISAACTYGMFKTETDRKAENCNQVSDSIFGYKTMLPLFLLAICSSFGIMIWLFIVDFILYAILFAATYGFAVMYKKTYRIGWKFALVLVAAAVLGIAISVITGTLIYPNAYNFY